jgi:hypothetical protein
MRTRVPTSQRTRLRDLGEQRTKRSKIPQSRGMRIEVLRVRETRNTSTKVADGLS